MDVLQWDIAKLHFEGHYYDQNRKRMKFKTEEEEIKNTIKNR